MVLPWVITLIGVKGGDYMCLCDGNVFLHTCVVTHIIIRKWIIMIAQTFCLLCRNWLRCVQDYLYCTCHWICVSFTTTIQFVVAVSWSLPHVTCYVKLYRITMIFSFVYKISFLITSILDTSNKACSNSYHNTLMIY